MYNIDFDNTFHSLVFSHNTKFIALTIKNKNNKIICGMININDNDKTDIGTSRKLKALSLNTKSISLHSVLD